MNKLSPFTQRQTEWFQRSRSSWFNIAEGGKRGSKNVLAAFSFCVALEYHPDRIHLAAGFSIAATRLNVLDCDGFGLLNYFSGRCKEGKYKDRSCLYIRTLDGKEKVLLISGGGKQGDDKLIKGQTYGMVIITEANECHLDFIREAFDRTMSSSDRKVFHDFNPKPPQHKYYTDVLATHEAKQRTDQGYGYNYGHFTIADNMSLSSDQIRKMLTTYNKDSVWYRRDILGLREAAEGVIYELFADNPDRYIIDTAPEIIFVTIGVDFGGNKSASAFQATGYTRNLGQVITIHEYYKRKKITPAQLEKDFVKFVREVLEMGYRIADIRADSEATTLIQGLQSALAREKLPYQVNNALKGKILNRIRFYERLLAADRFKVMSSCVHTIEALKSAIWDPKSFDDERLDDGNFNIDTLDAQEYSTEPYMPQISALMGVKA